MKNLLSIFEVLFGRWSDRQRHNNMLQSIPSISEAISLIKEQWPLDSDLLNHKPIFILSAGWRSGSTLLQRLVLSSDEMLVWGEPYAHCDLVRKLADTLKTFQKNIPRKQFFIDYYLKGEKDYFLKGEKEGRTLSDLWVANLYPMPADLVVAHRQFFLTLFYNPAKEAGFSRWGFKEVRLSADYALYLKFLFPEAKFLFLYRNPYNAFHSYKTYNAWYDRWPERPVYTPRQFGALWARLINSFINDHDKVGGMLIRYEDLAQGNIDFARLSEYLCVDVSKDIVENKVPGFEKSKNPLSRLEVGLLRSVVEPYASKLGYNPPK